MSRPWGIVPLLVVVGTGCVSQRRYADCLADVAISAELVDMVFTPS